MICNNILLNHGAIPLTGLSFAKSIAASDVADRGVGRGGGFLLSLSCTGMSEPLGWPRLVMDPFLSSVGDKMPCKVVETFSGGGISIVSLSGLVGFTGFDDDGACTTTGGKDTGAT